MEGLGAIRKGSFNDGDVQRLPKHRELPFALGGEAADRPTKELMSKMGRALVDDESRDQEIQRHPNSNHYADYSIHSISLRLERFNGFAVRGPPANH
jgi:hypothetical protein